MVLRWYSLLPQSTAGEYHIGPYFAGDSAFGGLQAGGCRFVLGWMGETARRANHTSMAAPPIDAR